MRHPKKTAAASHMYLPGLRFLTVFILPGVSKTARIEYDGYVSFSRASKKLNVLNSDGYIEYQKIIDPLGWVNNQDVDGDGIPETVRDLSKVPRHDWQDEIFSTGISQSHNITVSGGSKTTTFSGGLGYLGEQGIINSNTNKRYSLRLRVDHQQSDKFKVGFNINTAYTALNGATTNGNGNGVKYGAIQNIILSRPLEIYDPSKDDASRYVSPASVIDDAYKFNNLTKILLSTYADYKITKGLNFNITGGGVLSSSKGKEFYSKNTTIGYSQNGLGYIQNINSNSYTLTNRLTYQKSLANNSELNLMGAYEVNSYNFESDDMQAANFPDESTGIDNIAKGTSILGINSNRYKNNRLSWLGRANYNLLDRYLFTVSFRADGSDKFGANNKWGYFPSAAFAWKVSDENFMKNQSVISNLKARLSYGVTGNERIPPYQYLAAMQNTYYSSGGAAQLGLSPSTLANPDLKWENTIQYNAGLDFSLFRNRIDISADYYIKETKNTLLPVLISAQTGFREQYQNRGQINNTGVELMLHSNNVRSKNFQWETNFNITFNKNVIENLGDVSSIPVTVPGTISNVGALVVGQQIGTGYGYVFDGVYQIDDFTWQNNSDPSIPYDTRIFTLKPRVVTVAAANVQPGSFKFKDLNGDGVVDDINDRTVISHSQPKHYGGFSNTLRYKGFDVNLFFEWSYGREILNLARVSLEGFQRIDNLSEDFFYNRWTPNNPTNEYGTFVTNNLTGRLTSSYYVEDGSYLRFKTVTLGYNLPKNIASKVGASNARLYLSANNVYTWTNYTGMDPEVNYSNNLISGLDNLSYPRTKAFIIGVNVSF
jgi:TonB-linked SusC/RagA family outer membrane protein